MEFGSLFAGIGGFDLALTRAGCRSLYAAELDPKCNSVRRRHWPDELQITDVAAVGGNHRPDIVTAGWPCQGNSVAGRRAGMADSRSGLWGEVARVLKHQRPRWFLGENVPGILSVNQGLDWLAVLRSLAGLGYGFAYRILDAQHFGVAQRRRRVFVVGCAGDWRSAAQVLFERDRLPWHSPPGGQAGQDVAHAVAAGAGGSKFGSGRAGQDTFVAGTLNHNGKAAGSATQQDAENGLLIAGTLQSNTGGMRSEPGDHIVAGTLQATDGGLGVDRAGEIIPAAYQCHGGNVGPIGTLRAGNGSMTSGVPFVASDYRTGDYAQADVGVLTTATDKTRGLPLVATHAVRRLTPTECERLQGFPDGWTATGADGEPISDSARYRMLGNAVAVPCVEWIVRRIILAEGGQTP